MQYEIHGFCVHKGDQYFIGETFMGQTVCDKCLCSDNRGTIICSNICKNATKCIRNEHIYGIGMYFLESDGCNTCKCKPKVGIVCTNMTCTVDKVFCFFGKNIYATGDSFVHPDGQRNCVCRIDGTAYCKFRNIKPVSSDPNKCLYMGKEYDIGDIFPFNDVCNMCECLAKGRYACSKWNCLENQDFGGVHILSEKKKFCTYNGQKYKVAEVFLGDNGCSKCFCPASGKVKCVKKACSRLISVVHKSLPKKFCTYKGHEYRVAQVFLGDDGCSKCTCPVSGEVTCMKRTCVTIKEVVTTSTTTTTTTTTPIPFCMYNGYKYDKNDEFAGVDGCTLVAAPPKTSCIYNERTYGEGEEFEGADGCSKCLCSGSGLVTCMKQVCTKSRNGQVLFAADIDDLDFEFSTYDERISMQNNKIVVIAIRYVTSFLCDELS
ncbi:kielin chordin [Octopus vulgaris]|uniref:Kielin chordin n=1 Tax=Octopus vulgaris TaxID=6645 RepID=A0AA36B968_OCTVU|nr:kielin chordin [Octopus vulgaris]